MSVSDVDTLRASMDMLRLSIDRLCRILAPSLEGAPEGGFFEVGSFDPDLAKARSELIEELIEQGHSEEQSANMVDEAFNAETKLYE